MRAQHGANWWDDEEAERRETEDLAGRLPQITDANITRLQGALRLQTRLRERGVVIEIGDLLEYFRPVP